MKGIVFLGDRKLELMNFPGAGLAPGAGEFRVPSLQDMNPAALSPRLAPRLASRRQK